jgi:hypothetical protein
MIAWTDPSASARSMLCIRSNSSATELLRAHSSAYLGQLDPRLGLTHVLGLGQLVRHGGDARSSDIRAETSRANATAAAGGTADHRRVGALNSHDLHVVVQRDGEHYKGALAPLCRRSLKTGVVLVGCAKPVSFLDRSWVAENSTISVFAAGR